MNLQIEDSAAHRFLALEKSIAAAKAEKERLEQALARQNELYAKTKNDVGLGMAKHEALGPVHVELMKLSDLFAKASDAENKSRQELQNVTRSMTDALFTAMRKAAGA